MACNEKGVIGLCSMYGATGDEMYLEMAKKEVDRVMSEGVADGCGVPDEVDGARSLFYLYEKTGDSKYKDALSGVMEKVRKYLADAGELSPDDAARILPFYMEYETKLDKKEAYNDVIARFVHVVEKFYDEESGLLRGNGEKVSACGGAGAPCGGSDEPKSDAELQLEREGWFLAALADAIEQTSVEIYEHYRRLCDLYKQLLHGLMPYREVESGMFSIDGCESKGANARIAYSMLKACRMRVVLAEKYLDAAADTAEKVLSDAGVAAAAEAGTCDAAGMLKAAFMLK